VYDCLAPTGLEASDDNLFRTFLWNLISGLNEEPHRTCSNLSVAVMLRRLAVGIALDNKQFIHDSLYGFEYNREWRYGVIHTLRHDILSDGMQWEGSVGYHMLVMRFLVIIAVMLENAGVDIWKKEMPATLQDDGYDLHRGWGPKGNKTLKAGFDAFLYLMLPDGSYSLLHDQSLGNISGVTAWSAPIFPKAYEVYKDPRYAWVIERINERYPPDKNNVPGWFKEGNFLRLDCRDYPKGEFSFEKDASISLTGIHKNGCSLFPAHGAVVLRPVPVKKTSPGVYVFWGPHWAGHQSPAALHMDIQAMGNRITCVPHVCKRGYTEPMHLSWKRTTVAHNTVTRDQKSMFPYDFDTDSIWECDIWRDRLSDGKLEEFQAENTFKAARMTNDNVYPGSMLDRTVLVTSKFVIDVYRVNSEAEHNFDWTMHCSGKVDKPADSKPIELENSQGYQHFSDAYIHPVTQGWINCRIAYNGKTTNADILLPQNQKSELIIAKDPETDERIPGGEREKLPERTCLMVRTHTKSTAFISVWSFGGNKVKKDCVYKNGDINLVTEVEDEKVSWLFPEKGKVACKRD
jgi:hypothetical protein